MSEEEFLKIQKSVLKVNIHCEGCKHKVKKILQKIDGVFTIEIDAEQGKVTVSGNVDPDVLIKKLAKSRKHAEPWDAPKSNNNHNHLANQFKNMQIDNGKGIGGSGGGGGDGNNKGQKGRNNQPKGGGGGQQGGPIPQQLQQQLQQMKGYQDLKLPPEFKLPPNQSQNQKTVKFKLPEEDDDFTDDELDDEFDDDDFEDEGFDDDDDEKEEPQLPLNKMKLPTMGNGPPMMLNGINMMNAQKGANAAPVNGKKGGPAPIPGGAVPIQVHGTSGGNGAKKGGGGGGGNNDNQGGGNKNNGGKNGINGGGGSGGGGNNNKNNVNSGNGGKTGGNNGMMEGDQAMNKGFPNMSGGGNMSIPMSSSMPMPQMGGMGNMPMPQMGGMGNMPAIRGLPTAAMSTGAGAGTGGYFRGVGPDALPGNPYQQQQQQQYLAAVMNQQRAMGNERFQPMMYAPPPPAVNYMYPPPSYPYPPPPDPYANYFSDENTSSCNVM